MSSPRGNSIREIAERLIRALEETGVFVFDRDLIDQAKVSHLIGIAGVDQLLSRQTFGDRLVVYVLRSDIAENRCRNTDCRDAPSEEVRACMAECFYRRLREIVEAARNSIMEAASSIEGGE